MLNSAAFRRLGVRPARTECAPYHRSASGNPPQRGFRRHFRPVPTPFGPFRQLTRPRLVPCYLRSSSVLPPIHHRSASVTVSEEERRKNGGTTEVLRRNHGSSTGYCLATCFGLGNRPFPFSELRIRPRIDPRALQAIQRALGLLQGHAWNGLQVDHGRLDVAVPQQLLNGLQVVTGEQQMTCEGVPERVG